MKSAIAEGHWDRTRLCAAAVIGLGSGLVLSLLGLGLLAARDVSEFIGTRAVRTLYDDTGEIVTTPDYEKAEEEWGQGNFLEAIRILRDHLKEHPRAQHVALRIAEIYEKDLHNYLAAALEYEEVLKHRLPPERWGWAAIHLVNLYNGRLGPDESLRVFPLSNWTERDVWTYVAQERIAVASLYFAAPRPTVARDGG